MGGWPIPEALIPDLRGPFSLYVREVEVLHGLALELERIEREETGRGLGMDGDA